MQRIGGHLRLESLQVILSVLSLRGVGVVGHPTKPQDDEDQTATSKTDMVSDSFET